MITGGEVLVNDDLSVGYSNSGTITITNGGSISNNSCFIGEYSGSSGEVVVSGSGSTWTNNGGLYVGYSGQGTLAITAGGKVSSAYFSYIDMFSDSTCMVTVNGAGSMWTNQSSLKIGNNGILSIANGGIVRVANTLTIDSDDGKNGFINMETGGMLALKGDADDSLEKFLRLIRGTDAIQYWDDSISDWANITSATFGEDYTLGYLVGGCMDGYTMLCVGAPEPGMAGDANCDGAVDGGDAEVLARYWMTEDGAVWGMGDFNGDGAVNDVDATILAANWGNWADGSVPEPSGVVGLLGLCLAGFFWIIARRAG